MSVVDLTPGSVSLDTLERIFRQEAAVRIDRAAKPGIDRAAALVAGASAGDGAVYGVNTGFGKLATVRIAPEDTAQLQRNLILSHCAGVGDPVSRDVVRLMMVLKLISLGRGASGVRFEVIELIENMLEARCYSPDSGARVGRRVGRSGAACPYGRRVDRRGRSGIRG